MPFTNTVFILGNLAANPEVKHLESGTSVATVNVATNEVRTNQEGERKEHTEWHRVILWNKQAENFAKYAKKGDLVHIEGRLRTRNWEAPIKLREDQKIFEVKGGEWTEPETAPTERKYVTEIHANRSQILTPRQSDTGGLSREAAAEVPDADMSDIPY